MKDEQKSFRGDGLIFPLQIVRTFDGRPALVRGVCSAACNPSFSSWRELLRSLWIVQPGVFCRLLRLSTN